MSSHHHHENAGGRGHGHTHKNCGHHQDLTLFIPKLIETLSWEKKNENVLDYGCGNGQNSYRYLLPEILKHDSKLYSVDINEKLVELAKKDCAHPNVTYAVGNILEDFPFGDVRFDKIFSIYVFHFVPDLSKALARLGSLLKPGGQLAFTLHKTSYFNVIQALAEMDKWKEYTKGCDRFSSAFAFSDSSSTEATFEALMKKAGFKVLFTDSKTLERNYDDIDRYLDGTISKFPFIDKVPDEKRGDLREDVRMVVTKLAGIPRDSKQFTYRYQCIAVAGEKIDAM